MEHLTSQFAVHYSVQFLFVFRGRDLNCETHTMRLTKKGFVAEMYHGVSVRLSARALTSSKGTDIEITIRISTYVVKTCMNRNLC